MGAVITFPQARRTPRALLAPRGDQVGDQVGDHAGAVEAAEATVIILPVVRIERVADAPSGADPGTPSPPRKRRRRASRP